MSDARDDLLLLLTQGREKIKAGWCQHTFTSGKNKVCVFGAIGGRIVYDDLDSIQHIAACCLREAMADTEYSLVKREIDRRAERKDSDDEKLYVVANAVWNNLPMTAQYKVVSLYDRAIRNLLDE